MCLRVYLAADHALPPFSSGRLRVEPLERKRWARDLLGQRHAYDLGPGCACALLSDGLDPAEEASRQALLAELEAYVEAATVEGPLHALVHWAGDERKRAAVREVTSGQFRALDFDSAWDGPIRLTVRARVAGAS